MIRAALPEDLVVTRSMGWLYGAIECYHAIRIGNDINHPGVKSKTEPYANITYGKTTGSIADVPLGRDYQGLIRFARSAAQNSELLISGSRALLSHSGDLIESP